MIETGFPVYIHVKYLFVDLWLFICTRIFNIGKACFIVFRVFFDVQTVFREESIYRLLGNPDPAESVHDGCRTATAVQVLSIIYFIHDRSTGRPNDFFIIFLEKTVNGLAVVFIPVFVKYTEKPVVIAFCKLQECFQMHFGCFPFFRIFGGKQVFPVIVYQIQ